VPDNLIEQWLIGMRIADIIFEVAAWRKNLVALQIRGLAEPHRDQSKARNAARTRRCTMGMGKAGK
jgi:hypothetical protein